MNKKASGIRRQALGNGGPSCLCALVAKKEELTQRATDLPAGRQGRNYEKYRESQRLKERQKTKVKR